MKQGTKYFHLFYILLKDSIISEVMYYINAAATDNNKDYFLNRSYVSS
jgi:hypothetical protein